MSILLSLNFEHQRQRRRLWTRGGSLLLSISYIAINH